MGVMLVDQGPAEPFFVKPFAKVGPGLGAEEL
jgi:hypothetical protein